MSNRESGVHRLTVEDIKKFSEDLQRVPKWSKESQEVFDTLFNYFSQMILNSDFVKVVRCKDCKHLIEIDKDNLYVCDRIDIGMDGEPSFLNLETDFCSYGERKNNDE